MLGAMKLCGSPAITCAQHPAQQGTAGQGCPAPCTAELGWRVALEGHERHVHSVKCVLSKVSASETLFIPLVESLLQEIFCFCGNLALECFPPTLGRSSGLFIRIPAFLDDLNSLPCVPKPWSDKQLRISLSPEKSFFGMKRRKILSLSQVPAGDEAVLFLFCPPSQEVTTPVVVDSKLFTEQLMPS